MEQNKTVNMKKRNVIGHDYVSTEYDPSLNPFSSEFDSLYTDIITIPLSQIGRYNQSPSMLAITTPEYRKSSYTYRPIFNHIVENFMSFTAKSGEPCDKIMIANKTIGKIRIADGLLIIHSTAYGADARGGEKERSFKCYLGECHPTEHCPNCIAMWSDNDDIDIGEINICPYSGLKFQSDIYKAVDEDNSTKPLGYDHSAEELSNENNPNYNVGCAFDQ